MRGVGVALGPHRRLQGVEVDPVVGDAHAVVDGDPVAGGQGQAVGRGVHQHRAGLVQDGVGPRLGPEMHGHAAVRGPAALAHGGGHGLEQFAVAVHGDRLGRVVGDRDAPVADSEVGFRAGTAPLVATEVAPLGVEFDPHSGAGLVVVLRTPVCRGVVGPEPVALHLGRGGDLHVFLSFFAVSDGLVELRHDDDSDAVLTVRLQGPASGRGQGRGHDGRRVGHAERPCVRPGPADRTLVGDLQGVGAPEPECDGRLPLRSVTRDFALDLLAGVVGEHRVRDGAVLDGGPDAVDHGDVRGAVGGDDLQCRRGGRLRAGLGGGRLPGGARGHRDGAPGDDEDQREQSGEQGEGARHRRKRGGFRPGQGHASTPKRQAWGSR